MTDSPRPTAESLLAEALHRMYDHPGPMPHLLCDQEAAEIMAFASPELAAALSDSAHDEKYITRDECYRLTVEAVTAATRDSESLSLAAAWKAAEDALPVDDSRHIVLMGRGSYFAAQTQQGKRIFEVATGRTHAAALLALATALTKP